MKHKTVIAIILSVILICILLMCLNGNTGSDMTAKIYSDGVLLHEINLSSVSQPYEIPIVNNGHTNTVLVENGCISVKDADCPDRLCVKQGKASNALYPIVCLPNKLVIEIESSKDEDTPNAVSR